MKCPECGGNIRFEGDTTQMDCPYCSASIERPAPAAPAAPVDRIRALLEDKNGNGIPDIFEGLGKAGAVNVTTTTRVESMIILNGVQYKSLDDMPPQVRKQYEQITHSLGSGNMFQLPQAVEGSRTAMTPHKSGPGASAATATTSVKTVLKTTVKSNAQNAASDDAREKAPFNIAIYALLGVIILFILGGIAVWSLAAVR